MHLSNDRIYGNMWVTEGGFRSNLYVWM